VRFRRRRQQVFEPDWILPDPDGELAEDKVIDLPQGAGKIRAMTD
jgi:hypothetical protein